MKIIHQKKLKEIKVVESLFIIENLLEMVVQQQEKI